MTGKRLSKLAQLRAAMTADDWPLAFAIAARFPRLGKHEAAIRRAHEAYWHRKFYAQLGYDIDELLAAGRAALIERYGRAGKKRRKGRS
ncbi:MAG TPA: hypothetical protein VF936_06480 [Burkholderiales bacterium]